MYSPVFLFCLLLLFSCTGNNVEDKPVTSEPQDSMALVQVTVLANLPDSLQPKTILLENTPEPQTIYIPIDKPASFEIKGPARRNTFKLAPAKKTKASFASTLQNYTTEQGLAGDVISCSYTDKKGNLWFGTPVSGVSKYDGKSFTNYTSADGLIGFEIMSITEDKAGNIWFGTMSGVSKFDGSAFSTFGNFKGVNCILADQTGNLWFSTGNGINKYAGDSFTQYSGPDGVSNFVIVLKEDLKGNLWVGTLNGLFMYDGKKFTHIALSKKRVHKICIDKSGNVWAGNLEGDCIKYDGLNITSFSLTQSLVYADRLGNIWFSGGQDGLFYFDAKPIPILNKLNGFTFGSIVSIIEDKSGNLWFCTSANGVVKYSMPAFQKLTDNSLRSIFEDKTGNIWFAGDNGTISRFDGEYITNFTLGTSIWVLFQDKSGKIWMGSDEDGLIKFENEKSFTVYTDLNGLPHSIVRSIIQDSKGYLWFGTAKGLSKFDGKSFTNFTKKQGLAGGFVSFILEDKPGELLIGTDEGLSRYDGNSFTNYSIGRTTQGNDIRSLIKDKHGNLWMGTYGGGLCRYDGKSFFSYTTQQGLPDNVVTQVALTKEGNIAVGTNNGMALLTGFKSVSDEANNSNNPSANRKYAAQNNLSNRDLNGFAPVFEIFNPKTGYPVMDVNRGQHAIFQDSKGMLWIASGSGKSGLMRFDYSALNNNNNPPELNILAIKINNELICWNNLLNTKKNVQKSKFENITVPAAQTEELTTLGITLNEAQREEMRIKYKGIEFDAVGKFYPVPQNLKLPHLHNSITIEFAAIETDKPSLVQYQYMLEGYDKNWSTPANITSATFGNMFEGPYHFRLKARSPSGIWSETVTYAFTVLPPWWRTWWAYTIYVLLFLFALRVFSKYRERNLRMEKEKLEKTVQLRTVEIETEKKKSDDLLLNILPKEVAEELKAKGRAEAKQFDEVTVMFTDIKGFTQIAENLTPTELVNEIDACFKSFDDIIGNYAIEKIKTIGDSYMCAGGLPIANKTHATDVVNAALEIQQLMNERLQGRKNENKEILELRIGIHSGPVVAGIVGSKKFAYDIWGDTVNVAARMETSGEVGKVNISGATYELVKDKFNCSYRGKIQAKNKGEIDMYFVENIS